MSYQRLTKATALLGGANIGGGSDILKVSSVSAAINPGSIAATSRGTATGTITGAAAGDYVVAEFQASLNDDLVFEGAKITGANTVTIYLYNPTGGAIDDGSLTWKFLWFDLT